ncbi:MAG: hypothetical protein F4Y35_03885 [Chloroflexi bacterium]|nr:hypothetical protein [Chloroflexota bacterium]
MTDLSIDFVSDALPGSFYSIDIDIDYSETPPPDTTVEVFATFRDQLPATEGLLTEGAAVTGDVQQILSRLAG